MIQKKNPTNELWFLVYLLLLEVEFLNRANCCALFAKVEILALPKFSKCDDEGY